MDFPFFYRSKWIQCVVSDRRVLVTDSGLKSGSRDSTKINKNEKGGGEEGRGGESM